MNKYHHTEKTSSSEKVTPPASRRSFIKRFWGWIGLAAAMEMTWVALSFLHYGKKKSGSAAGDGFTEIANVDDIPESSVFPFRAGRLYLCRLDDGGLLALSLKCTHLGCPVNWDKNKEEFICPCHASRFNIKGEVLNPPATRPLDIYPLKIDNGTVYVNLGNPVARKSYNPGQEIKP